MLCGGGRMLIQNNMLIPIEKPLFIHIDFETRSVADLKATGAWKYSEHITLTEGRAALMQVRHRARTMDVFDRCHVGLLDNMGCTLAFEKGRCHDRRLLSQCRQVLAYSLACRASFAFRWVPSERNPSDAGSRSSDTKLMPSCDSIRGRSQRALRVG